MKQSWPAKLRSLLRAELLSPKGFLVRAFWLVVFFAVCHAAGLREHTTFLSGTAASADGNVNSSAVFGMIYLCAYFGFVLVAPILVLAAAMLMSWQRLVSRRNNTHVPDA